MSRKSPISRQRNGAVPVDDPRAVAYIVCTVMGFHRNRPAAAVLGLMTPSSDTCLRGVEPWR